MAKEQKVKQNIRLPSLPKLPSMSRNPPGWSTTEISIRSRGVPFAADLKIQEPAGDPPSDWTGTRPEWAIFWGLEHRGLQPDIDFVYQAKMPGVGKSYYSTLDFLLSSRDLGIEVQGTYWHYGQGTDKLLEDRLRLSLYAGQGIHVVFIDEEDALADPIYFVSEALAGNDHSKGARRY